MTADDPDLLVGSDGAMNTAAAGIALIKEFEGFPFGGRPYLDPGASGRSDTATPRASGPIARA